MTSSRPLWIVLGTISLAVALAMYWVIREGLTPRPIALINPTEFENLEQVGVVAYWRLRPQLREQKMLRFGGELDVPGASRIFSGLLATARKDGLTIDLILAAPQVEPMVSFLGVKVAELSAERPAEEPAPGHWLVMHDTGPAVRETDRGSLEIVAMLWHLPSAIDAKAESECQTVERSLAISDPNYGLCQSLRLNRKHWRKSRDEKKLWAVLERHSRTDFVFFVRPPKL